MGYMIEGGGSKTLSKAKKWLYAFNDKSHTLLNLLTNVIIDYLVMQVEAGAQVLQIFDSSAEYLNKNLYTIFCLPYLKKIRDSVKDKLKLLNLPEVPMVINFRILLFSLIINNYNYLQVLFAKGGSFCLAEQTKLGYEVLGIDWTVEPIVAKELVKGRNITLQGNLDPCALYASENDIATMAKQMAESFGTSRYIVNLGHGIYPDIKVEAVDAFIKSIHNIVT